MKVIETNSYWELPENRAKEASKYSNRSEFRKKKRTVYERCSYKELEEYFGKNEIDREHTIRCDFGMPDYYKFYKKITEDHVGKTLFNNVLRDFLKMNHDHVSETGQPFILPERIGEVVVRKYKRTLIITKDGQVKNRLPVNWKETKKLWQEDEDAKKNKILIRHTNEHTDGYVYKIIYKRGGAKYRNKNLYKMQINRAMKRKLADPIINNNMDAFLGNPEKNRR